MNQKMSLSTQKLDFEREIAEMTKKFTSIIRENENKNFNKQQELTSENNLLIEKDIGNNKTINVLGNDLDNSKNEINL